jgi:hypothetical protein
VPGGAAKTQAQGESAMNTKMKISFGMAALVAMGTIGFVPASADKGIQAANVTVTMTALVLTSPETPQDQVWDMTYGPDRPGIAEELVAAAADDSAIVDYTFG